MSVSGLYKYLANIGLTEINKHRSGWRKHWECQWVRSVCSKIAKMVDTGNRMMLVALLDDLWEEKNPFNSLQILKSDYEVKASLMDRQA